MVLDPDTCQLVVPCSSAQANYAPRRTGAPLDFDFAFVDDSQPDIRRFYARLLQRGSDRVVVLLSGISQLLNLYLDSLNETLTVYHDPVLEPGLPRVTDQEERVDKSHQPDLAGPALAVDQNVPGMDIAD